MQVQFSINTTSDIQTFSQNCTSLEASAICKNFEKCQEQLEKLLVITQAFIRLLIYYLTIRKFLTCVRLFALRGKLKVYDRLACSQPIMHD